MKDLKLKRKLILLQLIFILDSDGMNLRAKIENTTENSTTMNSRITQIFSPHLLLSIPTNYQKVNLVELKPECSVQKKLIPADKPQLKSVLVFSKALLK